MENSISVIICCYNSSTRLPETLRFISNQQGQNIKWEVIVVDNNSSDNTSEVAFAEWEKYGAPAPLSIVKEAIPGLSHAREAGIKHSQYDLLLFCDDDNWLAPNYLKRACQLMQENPKVGILGGLNTAVTDGVFPDWFEQLQEAYACGPQAEKDGEVSRMYITGAGMVLRRNIFTIFEKIGFVSQLTDRKGEELSSGGDSEICFVAILLGFKLFYSSELQLKHFIESRRLDWEYFIRMSLGHAKSGYKLRYYTGLKHEKKWLSELLRITKPLISRYGLVLIRDFFKYKNHATASYSTINVMEFEKWLSHVKSINSYNDFIRSIYLLRERIGKYNQLNN